MTTDEQKLDALIASEYFFARAQALRDWAGPDFTAQLQVSQAQLVREEMGLHPVEVYPGDPPPPAAPPPPAPPPPTGVELARQAALAKAGR